MLQNPSHEIFLILQMSLLLLEISGTVTKTSLHGLQPLLCSGNMCSHFTFIESLSCNDSAWALGPIARGRMVGWGSGGW